MARIRGRICIGGGGEGFFGEGGKVEVWRGGILALMKGSGYCGIDGGVSGGFS